jgi:hypothetical protein
METRFPTRLRQCPVCKKADPLAGATATCPRCGCDLSKSQAAHSAARLLTIAAKARLCEREYDEALTCATQAWALSRLPVIPPIACLAALLANRLPDLAHWQARAKRI